jgi:single-stranded-DNA-specific exonuclease
MTSIDAGLATGRDAFAAFLDCLDRQARLVVFCHFDADGLAAGALFGRALTRLGFADVPVVYSERGESAFGDAARTPLAALRPSALIVTDLGVNAAGVLSGVPTCYVDHHQPVGTPANATIISGYAWQPIPTSAWLAYELLAPLAPLDDLAWIAAVGTLSDLGDNAPWPPLAAIKKQYTARWLKEAVALINAARRASAFDIATPLQLLLEADGPKQISQDDARGAEKLRAYRAEVNAALQAARKAAPRFASGQPWALVQLDSPCQIHPLIAQQWRTRLPKYAVIAANRGYLPGVVAFSTRTARPDLNLPALLRAVDLGPYNNTFGYGHDAASGGHLPPALFNALLSALGFAPSEHVPV